MNNKRPNFFNGQFLKAEDFLDGQNYQMSALHEHNRSAHTWGIAEGLEPSFNAGSPILHIAGGLAIDKEGRQIRVGGADLRSLHHDFTGASELTHYVTLAYGEKADPSSFTEETGVAGHTRILEEPIVKTSTTPPVDTSIDILICVVTLNIDLENSTIEIVSLDETDRKKAGATLGDAQSNSLSLVTDQMVSSLWPKLTGENINNTARLKLAAAESLFTGNLDIADQLKVEGAVGIGVEPSTVAKLQVGGALKVNGNTTLDQNLNVAGAANVTGPANLGAGVSVTGDAQVSGTVSADSISATTGATVGGDLIVNGNLDVKGTTTTVNTTEMEVSDNIIRVNKYDPQDTPKQINGGLEVFRGGHASNPEAQILWDEAAGKWMAGKAGALAEIPVGPLSVDGNGNVGVGTSAPQERLDVNGHVTLKPVVGCWYPTAHMQNASGHQTVILDGENENTAPEYFIRSDDQRHIYIQKAGVYQVTARALGYPSGGTYCHLYFYVNGDLKELDHGPIAHTTSWVDRHAQYTGFLPAGADIYMNVYHSSTASYVYHCDKHYTNLRIVRLH